MRAIQGGGLLARDFTKSPVSELALALRSNDGPVWLVEAGSWPLNEALTLFPASYTLSEHPLMCIGATTKPTDSLSDAKIEGEDDPGFAAWQALLSSDAVHSDGGLSIPYGPNDCKKPQPPIFSAYLDASVAEALGERLTNITTLNSQNLTKGLKEAAKSQNAHTMYRPMLNVAYDSRIRCLQVITAIQRGGAERVVLDLVKRLPRVGVKPFLVTTGVSFRASFKQPYQMMDVSGVSDHQSKIRAAGGSNRAN